MSSVGIKTHYPWLYTCITHTVGTYRFMWPLSEDSTTFGDEKRILIIYNISHYVTGWRLECSLVFCVSVCVCVATCQFSQDWHNTTAVSTQDPSLWLGRQSLALPRGLLALPVCLRMCLCMFAHVCVCVCLFLSVNKQVSLHTNVC